MLMLLRKNAALWAAAGVLGLAGAVTSFAAAGSGSPPAEDPPPGPAEGQAMAQEAAPQPDGGPQVASGEQDSATDEPGAQTEAVRGVPEDSPACENPGCGEVENAGGVTLHLPQPAADGITRAAENREAARNKGEDEEDGGGDPAAQASGAEEDEESPEDTVRGVPEESPACEKLGCGEVTNPGGVTLHLPQPAVDGMNRAAENRAAAHDKGNGGANITGKGNGKP